MTLRSSSASWRVIYGLRSSKQHALSPKRSTYSFRSAYSPFSDSIPGTMQCHELTFACR